MNDMCRMIEKYEGGTAYSMTYTVHWNSRSLTSPRRLFRPEPDLYD